MFNLKKAFHEIIERVDRKISAMASWLKGSARNIIQICFGAGVIVSVVVGGLLVDSQPAAVVIVSSGTFFGFIWLMPLLQFLLPTRDEQTHVGGSGQQMEVARLKNQIEHLQGQQINVDSITPVLKMSFVQVEAHLTDVVKRSYNEKGEEKDKSMGPTEIGDYEYVGVRRKRMKVNVGADLNMLRLSEDGATIFVSGIEIGSQGVEATNDSWELKEIRTRERFLRSPKRGELVIQSKNSTLDDLAEAQAKGLQERINNGTEFRFIDRGVATMAKEWVRLTLSPLRKKVEFVDGKSHSGVTLTQFLISHNARVAKQIASVNQSLAQHGNLI